MFDLPDPFGPTMAVMVRANSNVILLAKGLSSPLAENDLAGLGQGIRRRILGSFLLAVPLTAAAQFPPDVHVDYKFARVIRTERIDRCGAGGPPDLGGGQVL